MVIRFQQFTNTEDRRSSFMKNFRRPKTEDIRSWKISEDRRPNIFVHEKFPNTEDRIVLFGPNYSRIPKNRSIRCNSGLQPRGKAAGHGRVARCSHSALWWPDQHCTVGFEQGSIYNVASVCWMLGCRLHHSEKGTQFIRSQLNL